MFKRVFAFGMCVAAGVMFAASVLFADTPLARLEGQPKFSGGRALGYFVWKDGDTWKLRWMTFGSEHRFSGRIHVEGATVQSLKRIDVDTERKIIAPGRPGRLVRGPRGRVVGRTGGRAPVVASRDEGGPRAVLEAMATGAPLVSTRVGQAADLVRDGENGWLVEVEDVEALVEVAARVASAPAAELERMRAAGRRTAEETSYVALRPRWRDLLTGFVAIPGPPA